MKQLKNVKELTQLVDLLDELNIELPVDEKIAIDGSLAEAVTIGGTATPQLVSPNRFAILPMEGWDGDTEGRPTDLVRRRWQRFGASGAGLVWGEATAVRLDGRANPNQLTLTKDTVGAFAELRALLSPDQVVGLQLTHSGRWSRPEGSPAPRTAYEHPLLDPSAHCNASHVFSDAELEDVALAYIEAAGHAVEAGFDFVDVKACHGYLLHEMLTAHDRSGAYGGDLAARSRLMLSIIEEVRRQHRDLAIGVRLSIFDLVPHKPGDDGVGVPVSEGPYPYAFGGDGTGLGIDLTETHELLTKLTEAGVSLLSTTAGSPYYCPHAQRPAYFPPSDGYRPPEDPLVGVARQIRATAEITAQHPRLAVVGSGYSYLQEWFAHVGQPVVERGWAHMIGLGRMALSHPDLPARVLNGEELDRRLVCRTFSDCTTAPRHGMISGCFPLDPFYNEREERVTLAAAKKEARQRLRR